MPCCPADVQPVPKRNLAQSRCVSAKKSATVAVSIRTAPARINLDRIVGAIAAAGYRRKKTDPIESSRS
jgi:hypothetical protein